MNVQLHEGDCLAVLATLPDASVDAVVTDPPASISFMNREWDRYKRAEFIPWMTAVMAECLRVLKPGGHALVWAIPRTSHWTATAIEDAGFEVRDVITHHYGSGFPKSLDVSKAIDKRGGNAHLAVEIGKAIRAARERRGWTAGQADAHFCGGTTNWSWFEGRVTGCRPPSPEMFARIVEEWPELAPLADKVAEAEREVVGHSDRGAGNGSVVGLGSQPSMSDEYDITAPATDEARQWQGWGTALKPATEMWILARRPLAEPNVASQVLATGTGALNIDATRIQTTDNLNGGTYSPGGNKSSLPGDTRSAAAAGKFAEGGGRIPGGYKQPSGRWPANLVLSHAPGCREVGVRKVQPSNESGRASGQSGGFGGGIFGNGEPDRIGGAHVDPDGTETVAAWECIEGCPVAELDRQSGDRPGSPLSWNRGASEAGAMQDQGINKYHRTGRSDLEATGYGDHGGASRFFPTFHYTAKSSATERSAGLYGYTVHEEISIWVDEVRAATLLVDTDSSPPTATAASGTPASIATAWSTTLFGSESEAPSLQAWRFITETRSSSTTESKILSWLMTSSISESMEGVRSEGESGGSPAANAAPGIPSLTITFAETASLPGVGPVASGTRLRISKESSKRAPRRSAHPTVKPVELMRWLCRLITPPGGTILDCFCGSGSTGVAAKLEGFSFIGIDQDPESVEIARRRLDWAVHEPTLFELEGG